MQQIKRDFIYPDIKPEHYRFGATNAGDIIREDGDWRDFLPPAEDQRQNGVESSACYIEAQQHAIATFLEEVFNIKDSNYAARFNALLSGGTQDGGDPLKGADSIRHDGLIPDDQMNFKGISSWNDYHSWKNVSERDCRALGQDWLAQWVPNNYIVFERSDDLTVKYAKLREALKRGPVPISVYAWDKQGPYYVKPAGVDDCHLTLCVYLDGENKPYFWDTYSPYLKVGEPYMNCDFAMRWVVKKNDAPVKSEWFIISFIKNICSTIIKWLGF